MVKVAVKGMQTDRFEIRPGQANQLKMMNRLAPGFILKQMRPIGRSYAQNTELIRMSILGKTSVDVVAIEVNSRMRIKIAATIRYTAGSERALQSTSCVSILSKHSFLRFKRPVVKECSRRHGRCDQQSNVAAFSARDGLFSA